MLITFGIACVPERSDFSQKMVDSFPEQHRKYVRRGWDYLHKGVWEGHRQAWLSYGPESTHHMLMEDDLVLCKGFIDYLYGAVEANPDKIISVYSAAHAKPKIKWAHKHGYSWFVDAYGASGQTYLMPRDILLDFLDWEHKCPPEMKWGESRVWGYMYERKLHTWNTVPSLVDHAMPMNSTLGFNNKGKVAVEFMGGKMLDIDWTKKPAELERVWRFDIGKETYFKYFPEVQ